MVQFTARKMIAIYCVFIGLFMISFWAMLLVTDQVPQDQKPWAISFHVAGEFLTAILLTISGVTLWLKKTRARVL